MDENPVDQIAPWTIKAISKSTRETVTRAAQRENLTVGQWLERRVSEWEGAGSPVPVADQRAFAPTNLGELAQVITAVRALAQDAGIAIPSALARDSLALARGAIRQARGLSPPTPRRKALASDQT